MACANQKVLLVDIKFGNRYALSRHIFRATVTNTFDRIFNDVWNDALNLIPDALKNTPCNLNDCFVFVSCKPNKVDRSSIALNETLETVLSLFNSITNLEYVFNKPLTRPESNIDDDVIATENRKRSMNDVLMSCTPRVLLPITEKTRHHKLFNDVIDDVQQCGGLLKRSIPQSDGCKAISLLVDALWYLDGQQQKIIGRAKINKSVHTIPQFFRKFDGYQPFERWRTRPKLEQSDLEKHSEDLLNLLEKSTITLAQSVREDVLSLSQCMTSYSNFLKFSNETQQERQSSLVAPKQIDDGIEFYEFTAVESVPTVMEILSNHMQSVDIFKPILIDTDVHFPVGIFKSRFQKHHHLKDIKLRVPVHVIKYDPGASYEVMRFIYRIPNEPLTAAQSMMWATKMVAIVKPKIPEFHTRAMRKAFNHSVSIITGGKGSTKLKAHVLRYIYKSLKGDASASTNIVEADIDRRVQLAVEMDDPDLAFDLRHLNKGRPGDTFKIFFEKLEKLISEVTAEDDRRNNIAHMSTFISIRDLIEQVSQEVPDGTPIPSSATVSFAFAPHNSSRASSKYYTGKVNLKHSIQRRQLHAFHTDAHYCNAVRLYAKHFACANSESTIFISYDDKAKIKFGEPGHLLCTGVRGRQAIVPTTSTLAAEDHDVNNKGSITPSVILDVDIPKEPYDSFYRGKVTSILKDSVFQPSNSFRTVLELEQYILASSISGLKDTLILFTDGGPEHRVNFDSVKIPLILLFKRLNLKMLVAFRPAPGHSYLNFVERTMSLLNIGLQNTALTRSYTKEDVEKVIKNCKGWEDLRRNGKLIKDAWSTSLQPILTTLENRIKRLKLCDESLSISKPATNDELQDFTDDLSLIDAKLKDLNTNRNLTKASLKNVDGYQCFLKKHCFEGRYIFQIRKSAEVKWMPTPEPDESSPGHYKNFKDLYGKSNPTDQFIPSLNDNVRKVTEEEQGCKTSELSGQNARFSIKCSMCLKPRVIYSRKKLDNRQTRTLNRVINMYGSSYICGCVITPEDSILNGLVFTRLALTCSSIIEIQYYTADKLNFNRSLCCYCGVSGTEVSAEDRKLYKTCLPICNACVEVGRKPIRRGMKRD